MRTVTLDALSDDAGVAPGAVCTLGVFDGVHRGHRRLLERLVRAAREREREAVVLTFAVHPVVVVRNLTPRLITSLPHRLRLFEPLGVDACVVLPFDESVRGLSAEAFARTVFLDGLAAGGLVLGPDTRIGRDRAGDLEFLGAFCDRHGLTFEVVDPVVDDGGPVSSTRIRAAITDGDLERASRMLGRPFTLFGTVVRGEERGRKLGYRTANLDLHHEIRPPAGVYAIRARVDVASRGGVLNIGIRPTFGPDGDLTVEAHLFDYDGDLYGRELEVELVDRLREEMRFESREELARQIERDCRAARERLGGG
ncbi:MAG: riboflavin biosynthesis protein RibF [Planctomycetota bacterium JB042]